MHLGFLRVASELGFTMHTMAGSGGCLGIRLSQGSQSLRKRKELGFTMYKMAVSGGCLGIGDSMHTKCACVNRCSSAVFRRTTAAQVSSDPNYGLNRVKFLGPFFGRLYTVIFGWFSPGDYGWDTAG